MCGQLYFSHHIIVMGNLFSVRFSTTSSRRTATKRYPWTPRHLLLGFRGERKKWRTVTSDRPSHRYHIMAKEYAGGGWIETEVPTQPADPHQNAIQSPSFRHGSAVTRVYSRNTSRNTILLPVSKFVLK